MVDRNAQYSPSPAQASALQHEPGSLNQNTTEANWPIRVGGVYRSTGWPKITKRVTALDGNVVHFERFYDDRPENPPALDSISESIFRFMQSPEDLSPFSALLERAAGILRSPDAFSREEREVLLGDIMAALAGQAVR